MPQEHVSTHNTNASGSTVKVAQSAESGVQACRVKNCNSCIFSSGTIYRTHTSTMDAMDTLLLKTIVLP